jgi:uncharacterized protein with HEPN domain
MPHDPRTSLEQIQRAGELIVRFTSGLTRSTYSGDELVRSAVERQFEIIGEGLNRLKQADPGLAAQVPEQRQIISFRNVLIHGYDAVVWDIVENELGPLVDKIKALLAQLPSP